MGLIPEAWTSCCYPFWYHRRKWLFPSATMKLPNLLVEYDGLHCASNHCWCEFPSTLVWWLLCWHGWQVDIPWKGEPPLRNCLHHNDLSLIGNWYRKAQCTGDCSDLGRWVRTVLEQNPASDLISRVLSSFDFKFLPCWSSCLDFPKPWTISYKMKQILSSPKFIFVGGGVMVFITRIRTN